MLMKIDFRVVILSEASARFADAESKDLHSPNPAPAAERLSGNTLPQRRVPHICPLLADVGVFAGTTSESARPWGAAEGGARDVLSAQGVSLGSQS
jgi:hypothetical protein